MNILQGEIGFEITLNEFIDKKEVLLNSPGGSLFEGLAMYDYVKDSAISVGVIGIAASAATLPLIASSKRWGTPNSRYLIHNPWNMAVGDADKMQKTADDLKKEQDKALNLYFETLTLTKEEIQDLMNEERILTAEEALAIGLITEIKSLNSTQTEAKGSDIKNLFNNYKMQINMTNNNELKEELTGIKLLLDKLAKFFAPPKMIIIQDVNGTELDFGEIETEEQIAVGVTATVNGEPANGEYVMNTGETFVFESGTLTEIKPAVSETTNTEELMKEIESLKAANTELEKSLSEQMKIKEDFTKQISELKAKFNEFQNKFSNETPELNVPTVEKTTNKKRVSFNFNKKQ